MYTTIERWLLVLMLLTAGIASPIHAETQQRVGNAYRVGSNELLYTETHSEVHVDGQVRQDTVTYRDASGAILALKTVDFARDLFMPDFELINERTGHLEAVAVEGASVRVSFRRSRADSVSIATPEAPVNGVVDAGFDRFIERHWDELFEGKVFKQPFLVPSRLAFYDFRIRRDAQRENDAGVAFVMEVDSALLRLFVSPIVVRYHPVTRALMSYEGISNMRDEAGENYNVLIRFPAALQSAALSGGS